MAKTNDYINGKIFRVTQGPADFPVGQKFTVALSEPPSFTLVGLLLLVLAWFIHRQSRT